MREGRPMIFAVALVATACLGLGWVLQQRVAGHATESALSIKLLLHLMSQPVWWLGIAAMSAGAAFGGWALQLGPVTLVEPLLSANLLFAFVFAALLGRAGIRGREIVGAVLLSGALGVFIGVGDPRAAHHLSIPSATNAALAIGVVTAVVVALIAFAKRRSLPVESAIIAGGAGLMYGLQDVATRASFVAVQNRDITGMLATAWPYVVVGSAAVGIALSQSAFRAARLDYSLPPTSAAEPLTGIALGVSVLGDRLTVSPGLIAVQGLCLVAMIGGVILIARSGSLSHGFAHLHRHGQQHQPRG
jgi:hypothetical protein